MKRNNLPDSEERFLDRAHYRIEVSGIETAEILEAVIDEAKIQGIPIHRAIATVQGSAFYSDTELRELAMAARNYGVEVIICPGNLARRVIDDPNKIFSNLNFQNDAEIKVYTDEIFRCLGLGFRGFLVWRKSVLNYLDVLRSNNIIPAETIFKLSTFDNNSNVLDFMLAEACGADTINAANNLTLSNLSVIRRAVKVKIDVHITFWQLGFEKNAQGRLELAVKSYDRIEDAPEIARVASPVYFKFEAGTPGIGVYNIGPDWTFRQLAEHKRKDVRVAAEIARRIRAEYPELKLSDWNPIDLRIPVIE